ncbi:hypothetical protein PILCRDRAFT_10514 [Piloderma croceum F 1598]|uniref:Uncharacterized protein n=1 Tax=Piloderma croceum (strain F 1598) TaxID=765440 RepID=A0A0C3FIA6_PILCF|nr:hypothetical protein PILCRDRAFT_10514 [Piloderma croceum F 1598]
MTPIILSTTKPGVQLSDLSTLSMSSPISTIITPDSDITRYQETNYDILLRTQARRHGAMLQPSLIPIWVIDPKLTKIREEYPSELPKLGAQNLLHLCDEDLAEHSNGFELHSARGRRGKVSWREFGYHVCEFDLHLYTITAHRPLPIPMLKMYVAVPDYLIAAEEMMEEINFCSLGQRIVPGEYSIRPPLRPWEKRKGWKHPAEREIVKFMNGEGDGFIEEWNEEYIDRMT